MGAVRLTTIFHSEGIMNIHPTIKMIGVIILICLAGFLFLTLTDRR